MAESLRGHMHLLAGLSQLANSPASAAPMFRSTLEMASLGPVGYCSRRATLGSGKNEKHPASKSAQAAPIDMPLATSLG
jgi:hypothetical protein